MHNSSCFNIEETVEKKNKSVGSHEKCSEIIRKDKNGGTEYLSTQTISEENVEGWEAQSNGESKDENGREAGFQVGDTHEEWKEDGDVETEKSNSETKLKFNVRNDMTENKEDEGHKVKDYKYMEAEDDEKDRMNVLTEQENKKAKRFKKKL